jgi:hypothetical protein
VRIDRNFGRQGFGGNPHRYHVARPADPAWVFEVLMPTVAFAGAAQIRERHSSSTCYYRARLASSVIPAYRTTTLPLSITRLWAKRLTGWKLMAVSTRASIRSSKRNWNVRESSPKWPRVHSAINGKDTRDDDPAAGLKRLDRDPHADPAPCSQSGRGRSTFP